MKRANSRKVELPLSKNDIDKWVLVWISHEPERCRNKAFQSEDVVFYFEG
jgi:hypothetical protein